VVDLVEWMCDWNEAHPTDPVRFFGFDVQQPWQDGPALSAFLSDVAPNSETLIAGMAGCDGATYTSEDDYWRDRPADGSVAITRAEFDTCITGLDAIDAYFTTKRDAIVDASSAEELDWAWIYLIGVRAWEGAQYFSDWNTAGSDMDVGRSLEERDLGMAEVFLRIRALRYPGVKTAIWAHNTHIAARQHEVRGWELGGKSMGTFLAERLGADYLAVGLVGYEVEINWFQGVETMPLPTRRDSVEIMLHALDSEYLLVDLAFPGTDDPFFEPDRFYELQYEEMVPADQFRALVYLDHSQPMVPIY
jgi:erythromycin esterase-like protein